MQERLLQALEKYEKFCGKAEIRVIATARTERISDFEGEPTYWDKLQWEKYPQLWNRFTRYELAKPEDNAIIELFNETIPNTNISAKVEDYPALASRNDRTFRNVVENLRSLKNNQQPLSLKTYQHTLKDTWEERYKKAVRKYPANRYIYDAVDLLRKFDIELQQFTVQATARMLAGGNFWQQLQYWRQIRIATNLLIHSERISEPHDGQIEAKRKQVEAGEYILRLSRLLLKLAERYPTQMQESLISFGNKVSRLGRYKEALASFDKAINISPESSLIWFLKGNELFYLGKFQQAIFSYDKAIEFKPSSHESWYNRGIALDNLVREEEAIASYDKAIEFKPDKHEAWNNRGYTLSNLGRFEEAITSYDKAIEFKPNDHVVWYNRGNTLSVLGNFKAAITSYDKAIEFKPDFYQAWNNRGLRLSNLNRFEEAIASYDQAIESKSNLHEVWYNRGNTLCNLGRKKEALASYNKAIEFNPDLYQAWYEKARCYALQGNIEQAVYNLQQAINLNPEECGERVKTDSNFDSIRNDKRFQVLLQS